jgi:hypothetical protein
MSGYRQSGFDPSAASGDFGPPLRPYNWVQWAGVAFVLVGVTFDLAYLGGRMGLFRKLLDSPSLGVSLPLIGTALVNSRRQPGQPSAETRRRRMLIIAVAFAFCILALGAAIYFKGA